MDFKDKYTTETIKNTISLNKDIPAETKDAENAKTALSDEAFAVCELLDNLTHKFEQLRIATLLKR